jgi:uncharacterized membrane protein YhaH (DUF805 family)
MKNTSNILQVMIFILFTLDYFLFESRIETCAFWMVIILYCIWLDVSLINKNTEK